MNTSSRKQLTTVYMIIDLVVSGAHEVVVQRYNRIVSILCSDRCLNLNVMALQEVMHIVLNQSSINIF